MKQRMTILALIALLISCPALSQKKPVVQASLSKEKVVIGEPFELVLEASFPEGDALNFFSPDSLPHFEILERYKIDTFDAGGGTRLSQRLLLTSWDSGSWRLPPLPLPGTRARTPALTVTVSYTSFDPQQEYHGIRDILDVETPAKSRWIWYLVIGGLVVALFFLVFPGKKEKGGEAKPKEDPYKAAIAELQQLRKEGAGADVKAFYVRLTDVLRRYLHQRKGIASFSQTTDDLARQIRGLRLPAGLYDNLRDTLQVSDAVKFARYRPDEDEVRPAVETVQKSIDAIESLP